MPPMLGSSDGWWSMSINDWRQVFPQTARFCPLSSRDSYGKPTYDDGVDYSARISYKSVKIIGPDGQEIQAKGAIWFLGRPTVTQDDKIVLPDGSAPPILSVSRPSDEFGVHHTKVWFG